MWLTGKSYIAYDFQFNPLGSVTRTFRVEDTIAPIITIIGNNPLTHERGNVYIDPGATALDYGNINYTNQIVITSDVCFNEVGTYSIVRYHYHNNHINSILIK